MPTIEIASINATDLSLNQTDFDVAIIEERQLQSHRGLFYDVLQKKQGTIIHIGNPEFREEKDGAFFADNLIDWEFEIGSEYILIPNIDTDDTTANQQFVFKFLEQFRIDIDKILRIALEKSPIKRVLFLTDYQFGPEKAQTEIIYTIGDFWIQHDTEGLRFNTLYEMYRI
jgi:hypothetical protein